ncbi:MAG: 30S ribosomal protein S18 [Candidatus Omnitrophica bacterium]|nr:30S ribosomal protein S18 [Candidatus Omnitrophota bacterium]
MRVKVKTKRNLKRASFLPARRKTCRFCTDKVKVIDYKDTKMLEYFIKERGAMVATRVTGNCAKHQRQVTEAVKRARFIALLPFVRM